MSEDRYLVRRDEIAAMNGLDKTHFLNPEARRRNLSLGDLTGLSGIGVHVIEVAPGCHSTEPHRHHHEDEAVYILSGQAEARIGDERFEVGPGDFLGYRKGGEAHGLTNTGKQTLRCLVIGERLAHDVTDYPDQAKRLYRNASLPWTLVDLGALQEVSAGRKSRD